MNGNEEIFCDDDSRLSMMKRVFMGRIVPLIVLFICSLILSFISSTFGYGGRNMVQRGVSVFFFLIFLLYLILFLVFGIQFYLYEKRVRKEKKGMLWKYIVIFAGILSAFVLVTFLMFFSHYRSSDYTLTEKEDGYAIGMYFLDEEVVREYELKKGDVIWVDYVQMCGDINIIIGSRGEDPIFTGNMKGTNSFAVRVIKDGYYQIRCTGEKAEGSVSFTVKRKE